MNATSRLTALLLCLLGLLLGGCEGKRDAPAPRTITYTGDAETRELISLLAKESKLPEYVNFDRTFKGLFVPPSLMPMEPFVLALSTESRIPTVLLLDAPWVQRYGIAGWLYELESTDIFNRRDLLPELVKAFSVPLDRIPGKRGRELVAVPRHIKGNILFYRQDLLRRYNMAPPRNWDELKAICRKILPQEKSLKYGLLVHVNNFINDFYPIFWGFGGRVFDERGRYVLHQKANITAFVAALREIKAMQGSIMPSPDDLKKLEETDSREVFYQGEALFMVNWNTRLMDLGKLIRQDRSDRAGRLKDIGQVGVAPIPCQAGQPHRYSNLGSFGWGVNRFSVNNPETRQAVKQFVKLVTSEEYQLMAAQTLGQVPALKSALEKVTDKEVLRVYNDTFALPDMVIRSRPHNRRVNFVLERHLVEVLYGQRSPEEALHVALIELVDLRTAGEADKKP